MDAAHIHLILNHFPIAGMLFAIPILVVAWQRKSETLARTGLFVVLATGVITIPTYLTGEPAEELIEHLPGISEKMIKVHEEAAEKAIWLVEAAAVVALVSLILAFRKKVTPRWSVPLVAALATVAMATLGWTNNLGGEIHHPEIRKDKTVSSSSQGADKD